MVRINVVLETEQGNVIREREAQPLDLGQQPMHEIEGAVETWHRQLASVR